jgi:adenylosuccinate synthase
MNAKDDLLAELLADCYELSEEFFSKGDVSRDTLLILAARTRLLMGQAKAEIAAEEAKEAAQKAETTTRGSRPTKQKKAAQKPAQGACVYCEGKLTGKQRRYCSKTCATKDWQSRNKDKLRAYSKAHYAKKKAA